MQEKEQQQKAEIRTLSEDLYSVEELEARLELATCLVDTLCVGNACGINGCIGNNNGW